MPLKIIIVGAKTAHGGTVISGSPNHKFCERVVALLGDNVDCPQRYPGGKSHDVKKFTTGCSSHTINGLPVSIIAVGLTTIGVSFFVSYATEAADKYFGRVTTRHIVIHNSVATPRPGQKVVNIQRLT